MVGPFCWDSLNADFVVFQLPAAYFKQQMNSYLDPTSFVSL